jgi:hypothetical protein
MQNGPKEWSELSTKYIDPFIRSAGHVPKETFIHYAINHPKLLFVTDVPSLLQERNRSFFTKEDRIEGLLTASWKIGGQEDIILVHASNHRDEIRQLLELMPLTTGTNSLLEAFSAIWLQMEDVKYKQV